MSPSLSDISLSLGADSSARAVLDHVAEAVFHLDVNGRIRWCNRAARQLADAELPDLVDRPIWEVLALQAEAGHPVERETFLETRDAEAAEDHELRIEHPAGGWQRVRLKRLAATDDAPGSWAIFYPEWSSEGASEADSSRLISTIGHEMRSPITSILGLSDLLVTRPVSTEKAHRYVEIIRQESNRLRALVEDLLLYQRLRTGRQAYRLVPVSLNELIRQSAEKRRADDSGASIHFVAPPDLPEVLGDASAVSRVLDELLAHALRVSPPDEDHPIRVAVARRDGEVVVTVQDRGSGFDSSHHDQAFEPFYAWPESNSNEARGTGLGLPIVKEIVQALGGRVWAQSEGPGLGSTFGFTLIRAEANTEAASGKGNTEE